MCGRLAAEGTSARLLVRDDAAWHGTARARARITGHDRRAKRDGGVRAAPCFRPVKAPWLSPIEPKWVHGKRAIVEPDRALRADEVEARASDDYGCDGRPRLRQTDPAQKASRKRKQVA